MAIPNRESAVSFTTDVLRVASDWQEGQDALANHRLFGPWLTETFGDDALVEVQSIIREAESRLGNDLPY